MATTYLTRTPSSTGTQTKFTFSFWVKITSAGNGADKAIFSSGLNSSNYYMIRFTSGDQLQILSKDNGNNQINYNTNQVFRDTNAWYHIVLAHDTTQSSGSRIKYYVNGEQVSSFQSSVEPSASANILYVNDTTVHAWGRRNYNSDLYTDMVLSHVHFCDGYAYQASDFGSTDSTTGEWKINTNPNVTYGTNGYFILKNGNSVTDQSGNSNNWTVAGGTLSKTEDNPSNIFAVLNPLIKMRGTPTYQSGNTYFRSDHGNWDSALSTIGATSGKWYFEAKWGNQNNLMIGCVDVDKDPEFLSGKLTYGYIGYRGISYFGETSNPRVIGNNNNDLVTSLTTFASGDIIGCAIDLDNREMFVHRNGTYTNSGNPATRANPYNMATSINQGGTVLMGVASRSGYGIEVNFGNGYFSSTAISSAGTNASNLGIFEYDVPSGYTALCTKGLNE